MSRKKKLTLILVPLVLLLLLWYTRPRSFEDLVDGREAVDLAAQATCPGVSGGAFHFNTWNISNSDHGNQAAAGVRELLASTHYRLRLRNLLPLPLPTSHNGPETAIQMVTILDDESTLLISFWGDEVIFSGDDMEIVTTAVDKTTADRIVSYMNEYAPANSDNTK